MTLTANNRCFPGKIANEITRLRKLEITKGKKDIFLASLDDVGFSGFKEINISRIRSDFILWCRDNFDPTTMKLMRDGGDIVMSPLDVHRVYGLPVGPKNIRLSTCELEDAKKLFEEFEMGNSFNEKINVSDLCKKLPSFKSVKIWRKAMIMCILGFILCPPTSYKISLKYATYLKDASKIADYNWCSHVLEHLQKNLENSKYPNVDFLFLMINYVDKVAKHPNANNIPTCQHWTTDSIAKTLNSISSVVGFGGAANDKDGNGARSSAVVEKIFEKHKVMIPINPQNCNDMNECERAIELCDANISAWSDCKKALEKRRKDLNGGSISKKRSKDVGAKNTKDAPRDKTPTRKVALRLKEKGDENKNKGKATEKQVEKRKKSDENVGEGSKKRMKLQKEKERGEREKVDESVVKEKKDKITSFHICIVVPK